ncbi:unnamed protein product (macronuclear) [Paramecium tetraurelia]|uniref:Uncharacterized protein n=1 Tax=Paramecium tetraurelia TaxID=5888 RepID=A0BEE8_PARTE|nr:uncharacterized protein GSPATT00027948001 [Paramecium tetraurelia]CAK56915.1 unnamed protein product [Paramecium tetraurelia]|eukprot:XP_001424313.1 hypothetical protein (macronuclear) [Paramecium tetraurelia strain d4-2]
MGDNNSNNSDGMQLLKTLLTADVPSEGSVMQSIRNKVNSLLNNKQQISILQELQQANLDNEFKEMTDNTLMGLNAIYFSSVVLTQFMFTRKVSKVVFLLSCAYFNFYLIQPIEIEYKLRKLALQNTLAGQEVRNLYRFYFQDHEFIKEMTEKCKLYTQADEIKKQIYSRKL